MAAKFIRFLTKAENTLPITKEALVSFPAVLSSFNDPFFASDPRLKVFFDQMKTGIHPPVHPLWIELEKIINTAVEKAMYGESADKVFAEAAAEYKRISERKENNRQEREQTMASASADPAVSQSNGGSMQITLLMLIAVGTIINAILLTFLVIEVKKNAR
jgi:hypothetical protein